jgi:hypothetical protein
MSFLDGEDEVKTAQLAKQESFSSASHSSNSSADSGCGNSDFNGVGVEGSEVDGPPLPAKASPLVLKEDEEPSADNDSIQQSPSSPGPAESADHVAQDVEGSEAQDVECSVAEGVEGSEALGVECSVAEGVECSEAEGVESTMAQDVECYDEASRVSSEAASRASSEEVDLTNVIPLMEVKEDTQIIDKQLQALHNHELLQQHVQEQLQAGAGQLQYQIIYISHSITHITIIAI